MSVDQGSFTSRFGSLPGRRRVATRPRRRCTGAATLTSADRSVSVHLSLLESAEGRAPQLRVSTGDGALQVVSISAGRAEGSVVEIELVALDPGAGTAPS